MRPTSSKFSVISLITGTNFSSINFLRASSSFLNFNSYNNCALLLTTLFGFFMFFLFNYNLYETAQSAFLTLFYLLFETHIFHIYFFLYQVPLNQFFLLPLV